MRECGIQVVLQVEMSLVSLRDVDGQGIARCSAESAILASPRFAKPEAGLDFQVACAPRNPLISSAARMSGRIRRSGKSSLNCVSI